MSSSRPKLTLDEQSFQDMLAAAFTIQEHNAKRRRALQPVPSCGKCGSPVQEGERLCPQCSVEELRPGEKLQQKWASMWLMGQEQGLWKESPHPDPEDVGPRSAISAVHQVVEEPGKESPIRIQEEPTAWPELSFDVPQQTAELDSEDSTDLVLSEEQAVAEDSPSPQTSIRDLRLKLRFHRADLYLVVAIMVSTFAMFWVLLATPAPGAQRRPRLRPWERAMVSLGLAESPEPSPQRGNPAAQVWVDPKTAQYYCVGDEQFGKTPGGRTTTQRDAQMNAFEPAARAACD